MRRMSVLTALIIPLGAASLSWAGVLEDNAVAAHLNGRQEVPAVITTGDGEFSAAISEDQISYRLRYTLEGKVSVAHIHIGQLGASGAPAVFLCSNEAGAPGGTPACPPSPGVVEGTFSSKDVVGPTAQGIEPTDLRRLVKAMVEGLTYVNVHSDSSPGGEIRGQIRRRSLRLDAPGTR